MSAISLSAASAGAPKGRAYSLCSQLRGWAAGTVGMLVCWDISPSPDRSHLAVVLVPLGLPAGYGEGKSCFGGMPTKMGGLDGTGPQGNVRAWFMVLAR